MLMTPPPAFGLKSLANRKAALVRHLGADHPRTLEASALLRTALLKQAIDAAARTLPPLTDAERDELVALLLAA